MISITFGNRVKLLRKSNNYTQVQLAKKVGITQAYLCMIESGGLVPSYPVIYTLADVLHTTTDYLLPEEYEWMPFFSRIESSRWIPCTERLPEKSGRYLVTRGSNVSGSLWNKVDILNYSDLMGLKKEKIWWSGNVGKIDFEKCDHVIAWMPLPEPYEESENKENDSNESLEQQRVGKWIINKEYNGYETIIKDCKCPFCNEKALLKKSYSMDGQSIVLYPSNYCPNCGAKMEVEENG